MSVEKYYEIEQQNLINEATKISLFTSHPGTIGAYREEVLKKYLRKFTLGAYTVKSGFIGDFIGTCDDAIFNSQSRQIDFLVYDSNKDVSFVETDNFVIVKPNVVIAAIEIKSNLTLYKTEKGDAIPDEKYPLGGGFRNAYRLDGTLIDSLKNILSISRIAQKYDATIFTAVFAYSASFDPIRIYEALDCDEIQKQLGLKHVTDLPFCICVPENFFALICEDDMFDMHSNEDPYTSFFSLVQASKENPSLPLQLFTNLYYNNHKYFHGEALPEIGGIFKVSQGTATVFSKHFDLSST